MLALQNQPCVSGCPVSVPIPEFIRHIVDGDMQGAYQTIKSPIPAGNLWTRLPPGDPVRV